MRKWRRQILSFILASVLRRTALSAGMLAEVAGHEDCNITLRPGSSLREEEYECRLFHSNNAKESEPRDQIKSQ